VNLRVPMTMVDDSSKYGKILVTCKNCSNHIAFFFKPKDMPLIGNFFCNLDCIKEYETKKRKINENFTQKTLK